MQIGVLDFLLQVRQEASFFMAAQLGFDCIELTVDHMDASKPMFDSMRSIQELSQSSGVKVSSIYAANLLTCDLFSQVEDIRQNALAGLRLVMRLAAEQQIPQVILPMLGKSLRDDRADRVPLDLVFAHLMSWEETQTVKLALKSVMSAEKLLGLLERHEPSKLGICFDPASCVPLERDPVQELALVKSRLFSVHLKDRRRSGERTPLGQGGVNLRDLFAGLRSAGFNGPVILETPTLRSAVESARSNLELCRRLVA